MNQRLILRVEGARTGSKERRKNHVETTVERLMKESIRIWLEKGRKRMIGRNKLKGKK